MEAVAQGDAGVPLGREQQFARIFSATKDVHNIVYLTADVHCTARDLLSSRPRGVSRCLLASPHPARILPACRPAGVTAIGAR